MAKGIQRETFAHAAIRLARHTTKIWSPTLFLITHFVAEIMLIAFLYQWCERPSSGFKCHLTADVAECIRWIYALYWDINGGTKSTPFCVDNALSPGQQRAEDGSQEYDTWQLACPQVHTTPTGPHWLTYGGVCGHIVWYNAKGVGKREILKTYSNSASKIHQDQTHFLMGQNLCWSVLSAFIYLPSVILRFFFHASTALRGPRPHYCGMEITLKRHTTLSSTPLDVWSACLGEFPWHHTTPTW
jgi:hypothetical protein